MKPALSCGVFFVLAVAAAAQSLPTTLPDVRWHLTGRPFVPVNQPKSELLAKVDDIVHALSTLQVTASGNSQGAIIDPYQNQEWQYSTPYFAYAVATDLSQGGASDLIANGVHAMDRATLEDSTGTVPAQHGEFTVAPIMKSLRLYKSMAAQGLYPAYITPAEISLWTSRMTTPRTTFMNMGVLQNWRTYAMKGEWLRQQDGLITDGTSWIESNWLTSSGGNQRARFRRDTDQYGISPYFLIYHDDTGTPETFAYNGGAAGNLLDMLINGYAGPSAADMWQMIKYNIHSDLLYMGGSGEAPAGGRSGDHVWNDIVDGNDFEMMAELSYAAGDKWSAGQYRHAAELAFRSGERFQQEKGWFAVTKNLFHPYLMNHYANYSALTNYNGYTEIHLSEAYTTRQTNITEQPGPSEIGGYSVQLDRSYQSVFIDAGGMQMQLCKQGTTDDMSSGVLWHTLGIPRVSRAGWDSRLGPADGFCALGFGSGVSFCPAFLESGTWKNIATLPSRYGGTFTASLVTPVLVRGIFTLAPLSGQTGPTLAMGITLTPDGALVDTAETSGTNPYGVVWPLLEYDGRTQLVRGTSSLIASTEYPPVSGSMTTIQAESGTVGGGTVIATNHNNYNGSGFADFSTTGGTLQWSNVNGGAGGATAIGFRYALQMSATGTRTVALTVNGTTSNLTFGSTGSWDDWHQLYLPVTLTAGAGNTITLQSTGQDCANIDELRVFAPVPGAPENDQQNYIALKSTHQLNITQPVVRGGYGDLRPVLVTDSTNGVVQTFVYPRNAADPSAETVRASFTRSGSDFSSVLGRVYGTLYVGRYSAGGYGNGVDIAGTGSNDVILSSSCNFIVQLSSGTATAIETDTAVTVTIAGRKLNLQPYTPVALSAPNYGLYRSANFTGAQQDDATVSGAGADPNFDGVTNLAAYAFGIDPWTVATQSNGGLPVSGTSGGYLTLSYVQVRGAIDLTYIPEVSGDLVNWNSGSAYITPISITPLDAARQMVVVRDNVSLAAGSKRFIRVRVTQQ